MDLHLLTDSADRFLRLTASITGDFAQMSGHEPWLLLATGAAVIAALALTLLNRH